MCLSVRAMVRPFWALCSAFRARPSARPGDIAGTANPGRCGIRLRTTLMAATPPNSQTERPASVPRSVHDGGMEFGPAPARVWCGIGLSRRGAEAVAGQMDEGAGSDIAERSEALSRGGDELAAVFDEAGECDPSQVGMAFDADLDVVGNLGIDLLEQRGECTKHPGIMVDAWS